MYLSKCKLERISEGKVKITGPCCVTGKPYSVEVNEIDLQKYYASALTQNAFPYLNAGQREFIISGMSPEGWDEAFGGDE